MQPVLHQKVNRWLAILLLLVITFWIVLFYFIERAKVIAGDLTTDYSMYLTLKPDVKK